MPLYGPDSAVTWRGLSLRVYVGLLRTLTLLLAPSLVPTVVIGGMAAMTALGASAAAVALGLMALVREGGCESRPVPWCLLACM